MTTAFLSIFAVFGALVLAACGLALLPALLIVGAIALAFSLVVGLVGLVLRIVFGVFVLLVATPLLVVLGLGFGLAFALLHVALPVLLVIGVIWLITQHARRAPPRLAADPRAV